MKLSRTDILLMAFCTGLIVANIYYCQPLVILIAKEFHVSESYAGRTTYLTQAGYALGLFLLVPLGDMFERRKQILIITSVAIAALLLAYFAPSFLVLEIACVFIGASSIVPQLILPMAANLVSDEERGHTVGIIMSGLLIGILASRAVSGAIGYVWGWRSMFLIAAGICCLLLILMGKRFPKSQPNFKGSYSQLMGSLLTYIKTQPVLREASLINFIAFATLSGFWTTMVLYLSGPPFNFQSMEVGLFGIAGAAGAMAAPLVGKFSDGRDPARNIIIGLAMELISIAAFYFTGNHVFLFVIGIILLDIGQQSIHVTNQTRIYALVPEARNRLNTVFMSVSFVGASVGSALGLWLWDLGNWPVFCLGSATLIVVNIWIYFFFRKRQQLIIA